MEKPPLEEEEDVGRGRDMRKGKVHLWTTFCKVLTIIYNRLSYIGREYKLTKT